MINFDSTSIKERILERLRQDPNWKVIANHSVIEALIKSNAEALAETARYVEYLFKESKWDSAQNESSILSMANMIGYHPKRKKSAIGKIYVSDNPKIKLVGRTIPLSTFKNLDEKGSSLSWNPSNDDYLISNSTLTSLSSTWSITDESGNEYVTLGGSLSKGDYYTPITIIQGSLKTVELTPSVIRSTATTSKIDPYLYIPAIIPSCENADDVSTKGFFSIKAIYEDGKSQEYRIVDSLLFSSSSDYDVEVNNDPYSKDLFYFKFNNDPNRGNILNISISSSLTKLQINYLYTKGSAGNIQNLYNTFTLTNNNQSGTKNTLYGINLEALSGGTEEENISDVKSNAPEYYLNSYSAGTKEAYENLISSLEISIEDYLQTFRPKKVQVYGSTELTSNGYSKPITCVSFLDSQLEDIASTSNASSIYDKITNALNSYLGRLKSPQDTIVFKAPNYVTFAVGIEWSAEDSTTVDKNETTNEIRSVVENLWGSNSENLNFERSFYKSDLTAKLSNTLGSDVHFGDIEVEAIKKLDWSLAERKDPQGVILGENNNTRIHTCRIPFSFSNIFYGDKAVCGFKDYRGNANYVMRVDFMYKNPVGNSNSYHTSLFIPGPGVSGNRTTSSDAFYVKNDLRDNTTIWNTSNDSFFSSADYKNLSEAFQVDTSYQVDYKKKVYTDNDFKELLDNISSSKEKTLETYINRAGTVDSYLIYFSANYNKDSSSIGNGFLEITFDPIFNMLKNFSSYDVNLRSALASCNLSTLKCGSISNAGDTFTEFIDIVQDYVDIYVSMRPQDSDLTIGSDDLVSKNTVLYIDSYDSTLTSQSYISNLTNDKQSRMISVNYKE